MNDLHDASSEDQLQDLCKELNITMEYAKSLLHMKSVEQPAHAPTAALSDTFMPIERLSSVTISSNKVITHPSSISLPRADGTKSRQGTIQSYGSPGGGISVRDADATAETLSEAAFMHIDAETALLHRAESLDSALEEELNRPATTSWTPSASQAPTFRHLANPRCRNQQMSPSCAASCVSYSAFSCGQDAACDAGNSDIASVCSPSFRSISRLSTPATKPATQFVKQTTWNSTASSVSTAEVSMRPVDPVTKFVVRSIEERVPTAQRGAAAMDVPSTNTTVSGRKRRRTSVEELALQSERSSFLHSFAAGDADSDDVYLDYGSDDIVAAETGLLEASASAHTDKEGTSSPHSHVCERGAASSVDVDSDVDVEHASAPKRMRTTSTAAQKPITAASAGRKVDDTQAFHAPFLSEECDADSAAKLLSDALGGEKNIQSLRLAIEILGRDAAWALLLEVMEVQSRGGMPTADGTRRRTAGGVFFVLLKDKVSKADYKLIFAEQSAAHTAQRNKKRRESGIWRNIILAR